MNPNNLGRPPSYTYAQGAGSLGAPPHQHGRSTSPMPPPPIHTGAPPGQGYPPPQQMYGQQHGGGPPGYPPPAAPAQYGGGGYGAPPPQGPQSYNRPSNAPVEVEGGAGRSKAQLIVGIDFVRAV